jgi:hypothetical protein
MAANNYGMTHCPCIDYKALSVLNLLKHLEKELSYTHFWLTNRASLNDNIERANFLVHPDHTERT